MSKLFESIDKLKAPFKSSPIDFINLNFESNINTFLNLNSLTNIVSFLFECTQIPYGSFKQLFGLIDSIIYSIIESIILNQDPNNCLKEPVGICVET